MKTLIGFIIGCMLFALIAATSKKDFRKMVVEKYRCDPARYTDCQADHYAIDTFIVINEGQFRWSFYNKLGNKVIVTLK